ncbi:uncharacterized protein BX664DRAFT_264108 [Halteromyces radiatus]|uniref:uncharacterized protein n=1 Tax=Halteromyces radiatus TaxID=101107 RepID=UPI00221F3F94|nr:uncharacterized protein BX664DRAFT_264108 [Halteromyces radiatus]KAI8088872.1 hypothetical protein BX664DRAFT_264108 [Halteromyces radiatus]
MLFYRGPQYHQSTSLKNSTILHPWLTVDDELWQSTDRLWRDKMKLHLQLANTYLDIEQYDYDFAEKKNLSSLCWKRAIYSLVEQLRQAFRRHHLLVATLDSDKDELDDIINLRIDMNDGDASIPVMTENGMTMIPLSDDDDDDDGDDGDGTENRHVDKLELQTILDKHLHMLRIWMNTFISDADGFYQHAMVVILRDDDHLDDNDKMLKVLDDSLLSWWRSRRWKWTKYIPYRGDLARYRFIYGQQTTDYELAWCWYSLGAWMIPATGRFYFHLSLLLNAPQYSPLHELHKLYFGTRSLMVRRNGFLNAREGLITLFENNRQWQAKVSPKQQQQQQQQRSKRRQYRKRKGSEVNLVSSDKLVTGLFIRLHGMLFTRIDLDSFMYTKRRYFETLFPMDDDTSPTTTTTATPLSVDTTLSGQHMFWLETILMNLSALYNYDYASSTLAKAVTLNKMRCMGCDLIKPQQEELDEFLDTLNDSLLFEKNVDVVNDEQAPWLIYIQVLLQWLAVTGIGIRPTTCGDGNKDGLKSMWETVVGNVMDHPYDNKKNSKDQIKMTGSFWRLLMSFLTQTLHGLPDNLRYQVINRHLLDQDNQWATDEQHGWTPKIWDALMMRLMGPHPYLPEEEYLRGLGWLDDLFLDKSRIRMEEISALGEDVNEQNLDLSIDTQRRIKILDYGFILVQQMNETLEYDPVHEQFLVKEVLEESCSEQDTITPMLPILTAMDDAVLFDTLLTSGNDEEQEDTQEQEPYADLINDDDNEEEDDMMGQLKKRREHLQSMLATMTEEKKHADRYGYQKLSVRRGKEREARLDRLREKVVPGQTVLVLDTNCFIGHMDTIRKLIQGGIWSIVIPLVVITELDGLKGNAPPLGTIAAEALTLIETTLVSNKQKGVRPDALRIQTSHHNFMHDISIRSEQFVFGETDKNLDDLILSTCLWWIKKQQQQQQIGVPVCLVTADRNLSVKARARDVQVIPVSGLMELDPSRS